ncbi:50S ribosomal protein L18 [Mycoplasma sp. SG1]|uniref:50S ribosomal protein L18 n=1 Tax=Mycoplasma sp. SG1 TaxID=2810348 RepID=UPI002023EA1F|nr:50S ribosomal protein L18 [Mycoplasma sp. SG1]URM52906.1 50S ribosomal protein L18 [Mycoplasma sp. SG1]
MKPKNLSNRKIRHLRIRKKVYGTEARPRLCVFKSNKYLYCQIINDEKNFIICGKSTKSIPLENKKTLEASKQLGIEVAKLCQKFNITNLVFDRAGYLYHGKIKQLADTIRQEGIKI